MKQSSIKKKTTSVLLHRVFFCFFLLLMGFGITTIAQEAEHDPRVSIVKTNVSIKSLLTEIEQQTDFTFFYNNQLVDVQKTASLRVENKKLSEALTLLFEKSDVAYRIIGKQIALYPKDSSPETTLALIQEQAGRPNSSPVEMQGISSANASLQSSHTFRGTILDEEGNPLPGAMVVVKGNPRKNKSADISGKFELTDVAPNTVLVITFLGYETMEYTVTERNNVNIQLRSGIVKLEEVMVVAYGSAKKTSYVGSATSVGNEKIEKLQVSNIVQALQGMSGGVQVLNDNGIPGSTPSVIIRGIGSMNASSMPLYVVDGTPFNGSMNAINPNDVESMTVLKDAAAAALYGSRAANGIIMITTKSGKANKSQVNFKSTFGFSDIAVPLPRTLNPREHYEMTWEAIYNKGLDDNLTETSAAQRASNMVVGTLKTNPFDTPYPIGLDGKLDPAATMLFEGDWIGELMKARLRQEYMIDFSGGNNSTNYFVSAGYSNDKGIYTVQQFERFSGRVNVNSKVRNWLEIGTNIGFSHTVQNNPGVSLRFIRSIPGIYPIYEWDYSQDAYALDSYGNKIYDYGTDRASWVWWNPLADAAYNRDFTYRENLSSRTFMELTFLPGLKFRTNLSLDFRLNSYHGYASATHGNSANFRGEANKETNRIFAYTLNNLLTYDKTFGNDHHINVLLGQEAHAYRYNTLSGTKRTFPFGGLYELASAALLIDADSYEVNYRLLSWLSRVEYDYKDRYYVSGSFRTDGSSRFHADSRWGNFWSIGASWRLSQEEFMPSLPWLNNLKLKTSYGAVGNDQVNTYYAYQGLYASGQNDYNNPGILKSSLSNPELRWESNLQLNTGIDFRIFNRIDGSIEWFQRTSKDLLFTQPMALSTGYGGVLRNIGTVRNSGIEFQITAHAIVEKDFRWIIDLNMTHYKNSIVKLPQEVMNSGYHRWIEGRSRYDFWIPEWAGVNPENGKSQWWKNEFLIANGQYVLDKNGHKIVAKRIKTENYEDVSNDDNKIYHGSAIPDLFGGLSNTFYLYDFDLSVFVYYSIGGKLYDNDYALMMGYVVGDSMHEDLLNRWTPNNKQATVPRMSESDGSSMIAYSTRFLYDNTFVRLRNVSLGYTLPKAITQKVNIERARIFVQGDNLLTFGSAAQRGTDPEQSFGGTSDYRFPTTKNISFGVQISF